MKPAIALMGIALACDAFMLFLSYFMPMWNLDHTAVLTGWDTVALVGFTLCLPGTILLLIIVAIMSWLFHEDD